MTNDSALFEDDFDLELEVDVDPGPEEPAIDAVLDDLPLEPEEGAGSSFVDAREEPDDFTLPVAAVPAARPVPAISAVIFHEREETAQTLRAAAQDRRMARATVDLYSGGLEGAVAYMRENATPNLLIIESSLSAPKMLAAIDDLASHCDEGVEVLVIGAHNDIRLYRELMARGVSEYLVPPVEPLALISSISELFADPDAPFLGKSVAVIGAKGGAGASTIAHNLAWSMAENARLSTTLVDLDLSFGTTALDFNRDDGQTVLDALIAPERADEAVLSRLLSTVTDRLSLFTAPASVNSIFDIAPDAYQTVIESVQHTVPYIVLDLPHLWSQWMLDTLVNADEVVLVCKPDLATLRNAKNLVDQLANDRPNDARPRLIVNMAGMPAEIPVKDFASALELEPEIVLPFDPKLFGDAANNGQMLTEAHGDTKPAQAIDHLASVLTGQIVTHAPKTFFQKLLGK